MPVTADARAAATGYDPSPTDIAAFWERHPVGADFVPAAELRAFFDAYDRRRHATEGHVRELVAGLDLAGKSVLEIGLGQGTESQALAARAERYTGADLTRESVRRVARRFELNGIRNGGLTVLDARRLAFADERFDVVFSHGVIHHSPDVAGIVAEIHRVLRPGGRAVVMVYHRHSLNYHLSIRVLRRLGVFALPVPGVARAVSKLTGEPLPRLMAHRENLRARGLGYLRMENFIHASTDGPRNPYASVWSEREARALFGAFRDVRCTKHLLNERHFPVLRLLGEDAKERLASRFGWHLWIWATK